MEIKEIRRTAWLIALVLALIILMFVGIVGDSLGASKKEIITLSAPNQMSDAFSVALNNSELSSSHKISVVDDTKADIIVANSQDSDKTFIKFAYSPFIIACNSDKSLVNSFEKSNTLMTDVYNADLKVFDMNKVINAVINDGNWESLGVSGNEQLKIFYPDESSEYYDAFQKFMLVNLNGGIYPKNNTELENAEKQFGIFINNDCTEGISDYSDKLNRIGGFTKNVLWIMPEVEAYNLHSSTFQLRALYPQYTTYLYYYMKPNSDNGEKVISGVESKFYSRLNSCFYRNDEDSMVNSSNLSYIVGIRNEYNIITVPE